MERAGSAFSVRSTGLRVFTPPVCDHLRRSVECHSISHHVGAREVAAHDDTPAIEDAQLEASPSGTHDMVDPVPSLSLRVDGIDDSDGPTEHEAPSGECFNP